MNELPNAFAKVASAFRRATYALRVLSGEQSSARTGRPILYELDEVEWPWGTRYYRDHPTLRAYQRRHAFYGDQLMRGAARVLYAPVGTPPPSTIGDVLGWTDLGATR